MQLSQFKTLAVAAGISFFACACEKKAEKTESKMSAAEPESVAAMPEPAGKAQKVVIGIAECDVFLNKYRRCVDRLPTKMREKMKSGLQRTEQTWLKESKDTSKINDVRAACTELDAATGTAMRAQGCDW